MRNGVDAIELLIPTSKERKFIKQKKVETSRLRKNFHTNNIRFFFPLSMKEKFLCRTRRVIFAIPKIYAIIGKEIFYGAI